MFANLSRISIFCSLLRCWQSLPHWLKDPNLMGTVTFC
jgi:hypothetical protein